MWVLLWSIGCLRGFCLIFTNLWVFQFSFCYWCLTSSFCDQRRYFFNSTEKKMIPKIWSILDNTLSSIKKNVYSVVWGCLVDYLCCSGPLLTFLLSGCSIHYWGLGIEVSNYYYILSISQILKILPHIFWWSVNKCANVYNCYIF